MQNVFAGALKGKTRVLVTHFLNLLEDPDVIGRVILIKEGKIVQEGRFQDVKFTPDWREFSDNKEAARPVDIVKPVPTSSEKQGFVTNDIGATTEKKVTSQFKPKLEGDKDDDPLD